MTPALTRIARTGYAAARYFAAESSNPWPRETLGAYAWNFGWAIGSLPPVARLAFAWVWM